MRRLIPPCLPPCLLLAASLAGQTPALRLQPGHSAMVLEAPVGGSIGFTVVLPPHAAARLTLQENEQTAVVAWTGPSGRIRIPRSNRAGRRARIRFTLVDAGVYRFTAASASRSHPARLLAHLSALHPATPRDRAAAAAEDALAQAEQLWARHDPGNAAQALPAFDRAIGGFRALGSTAMLRAALTWKAVYLAFTANQPRNAVPLLRQALALPPAGDPVEQANAWKTAGFAAATLADYASAWHDYARALQLFRQTGDRFNQEVMLDNRGKLSRLTGDDAGALRDARAALGLARALGDQVGVLHLEDDLGDMYLAHGQMRPAYAALRQVLDLARISPGDPMLGFAETDLATLYHRLGADGPAADLLRRAQAFWKAHPYTVGELATLTQAAGQARDLGQWQRAHAAYASALALARAAGMRREIVFLLLGEGKLATRRGKAGAAAADLHQAAALAAGLREGDAGARIANAQGDLAMQSGHWGAAETAYRQALDSAAAAFDQAGQIAARGGIAHAELASGQPRRALAEMVPVLATIERTRARIPAESLRTSYFDSLHGYYALAIAAAMQLARQHPGAGYARQGLRLAERARARSLRDEMLRAGRAPAPASGALQAASAANRRELDLAESSLVAARGRDPRAATRLAARVAALQEREDQLEARDPAQAAVAAGRPVARLQAQLPPRVALLEYWTGTPASFLWVMTRHRLRSFRLPASTALRALVSEWTRQMRRPFAAPASSAADYAVELANSRRQSLATVRQLRDILLPAGALSPRATTVLVVGDGPILSVPFALLEPDRACVREPSIAVLLDLLARPARPADGKIAIFADPAGPEPGAWARAGGAALPPLRYAAQEARTLASLAGARVATLAVGGAASGARVRATNWRPYAIVHFATHALLDPAFPELSSLVLAPPDAQLWYADIARLHMPVGLVTLSACQTANGDLLPGEGLEGLSYAFFEAGARRVLGSLWDVDDAATAAFMTQFYGALLAGRAPPQALRLAQHALARNPRWRNPYYWSGFTLAGDWRPMPAG